MKILTIMPFLKGWRNYPKAGGKDKAALEFVRGLNLGGHEIYIQPMPFGDSPQEECLLHSQHVQLDDGETRAVLVETGSPLSLNDHQGIHNMVNGLDPADPNVAWQFIFEKKFAFIRAVQAIQPDVIHVHQTGSPVVKYLREQNLNVPIVLTHHSVHTSPFLNEYDHVVFVSEFQKNALAPLRESGRRKSHSLLPYFVSGPYIEDRFIRTVEDEIVFMGLLDDDRKGLDLLLQAYVEQPDLRCYHLQIIGEGQKKPAYESFVKAHNIPATFHGKISDLDNTRLISRARLFVMPSRSETFGIVYPEALCLGVPVVGFAPTVREIAESLQEDVGVPFDANTESPGTLAEAILRVGESHLGTGLHADLLRQKAREYYGVDAYHSRYQDLYRKQPWKASTGGLSSLLSRQNFNIGNRSASPAASSSNPSWEMYRNAHQGERCFIIGNGPSLRPEDLQILHDNKEWCFGSNKIWKVFPKTDWRPNFYGVDCTGIVTFNQQEIADLPKSTQIFAGHYLQQKMPEPGRVLWMVKTPMVKPPGKPGFTEDASKVVNGGGTITYSHMQLAAFMGFSEIYLLGVDFSYNIVGNQAHPEIQGHGTYVPTDKENYFVDDYFKPGEVPVTPTLDESYQAYLVANDVGPMRGFMIYNATRGGKLEVFPRVDLDMLFDQVSSGV